VVICRNIYCYNPPPALRIPNGACATGGTGNLYLENTKTGITRLKNKNFQVLEL